MNRHRLTKVAACATLWGTLALHLAGQETPVPAEIPDADQQMPKETMATPATDADTDSENSDALVVLEPFTVTAAEDEDYAARYTLAGTRIRTDVKDVGSSITVVTQKFLQDTNTTNSTQLLVYTPSSEVVGPGGNFLGSGDSETAGAVRYGQTRVRGLVAADNTREFYLTSIPWDSYNTGRIDIQRGANSILFGIGSPAGIINASINHASFSDSGKVENQLDNFGTVRFSGDFNKVLIDDQLAIRLSLLDNRTKYRQEPAFRDDQRVFGALRWDPTFMNTDSMKTSIEASYEKGNIESNLPRQAPPGDFITPWFTDLQHLHNVGMTYRTGSSDANLPGNEYIIQAGSLLTQGGQITTFLGGQQTSTAYRHSVSGQVPWVGDGFVVGIDSYSNWAIRKRLPGYTINAFRNRVITDPTTFDFYNNLLDGDSKGEFNDFSALDVAFRQSFFDDSMGYELAYDRQTVHSGGHRLLNDTGYGIVVDVMATLHGGTIGGSPNPAGGTFEEVPDPANPHFQRAYAIGGAGSDFNWTDNTKENWRGTAYFNLDFNKISGKDSTLGRLLGKNTFTVLATRYRDMGTRASGNDYYTDDGYELNNSSDDSARRLYVLNYLSSQPLTGTTAHGLHLPRLGRAPVPGTNQPIQLFTDETKLYRTATFNTVINSSLPERQRAYSSASKQRGTVDSEALVWQGYWLGGNLIPMVGLRTDESYIEDAGIAPNTLYRNLRTYNPYASDWVLGDPGPKNKVNSQTYSVVTHLPRSWREKLPGKTDVQLIYNQSENFDPRPGRVDVLNRPLPNPAGTTKEYGIAFSALDDKIYMRLTRYETEVKNADISSVANLSAFAALEVWSRSAASAHAGLKPGGVGPASGNFQVETIYGTATGGGQLTFRPYGPNPGSPWLGLNENEPAPVGTVRGPYTQQEIDFEYARQIAAVQAVLDNPPPDAFIAANGINSAAFFSPQGPGMFDYGGAVANAVITGTTISKGTELELVANPIAGLSISLNVSKTDATRVDMAQSYLDYVDSRREVFHGPAGDMRFWNSGWEHMTRDRYTTAGNASARDWFDSQVDAPIAKFKALEGSNVPELKPWAFNVIGNYAFQGGPLANFNVGGAYRWLDRNVTGYPVIVDPDTGLETLDVDNPYEGPTEGICDMWIGYRRKLSDRLRWRAQLNVRNIFANDGLMRTSTNPDGTPGAYRIPEPRTFTLTNTFEF